MLYLVLVLIELLSINRIQNRTGCTLVTDKFVNNDAAHFVSDILRLVQLDCYQ